MSVTKYVSLSRRFIEISTYDFENEVDSIWEALSNKERGQTWEEILSNDISVLLGTAGSGKTTEVQQQVRNLVESGQDAFLLRLEALQDGSTTNAFDYQLDDQAKNFEQWKRTGRGGILFFDALDEARLPSSRNESALERALSVVSREIGRRKSRLHLVVTSRPSEWLGDGDIRHLALFIRKTRDAKQDDKAVEPTHKVFRMAPLSTNDIEKLASSRDVNSDDFLEAVYTNLSSGLIQQPLDAHLFLDVWKKGLGEGRTVDEIFKSRLQVMSDLVTWRLLGKSESKDRLGIDIVRARKAAAKLAAFVVLSGQQDLAARPLVEGLAISAAQILSNDEDTWTASEIRELLACGLFQPSVGGRIRFSHRELRDFLAAEHFDLSMRARANSASSINPLFADGLGRRSIPQSTEHVMGWLSALNGPAKAIVAKIRPSLLIETGDPKSLSLGDKELILRNQAKLYVGLRFRGEWFYHDVIKRFTHPELSSVVAELLDKSSSSELTDFLIEIARFGGMKDLAPKLASYVYDPVVGYRTKADACAALHEIGGEAYRAEVLTAALYAACPALENTDAAPHWNMFQLRAIQYCFGQAGLLDIISLLSRIQRERANYSSATSRYLIEVLEDLTAPQKRMWLSILLRFAFTGRTEAEYKLPTVSARYNRFVPAIIYLASELISDSQIAPDDRELLDAIEMAFGKENRIDVFGRKAPTKSLAEGLRARPEVKYALVARRISLFSEGKRRKRVIFGTVYPLEFEDKEENGAFFEGSDVIHYCRTARETSDQSQRAFLLDLAQTIFSTLRSHSPKETRGVLLKHMKELGDDEQRRNFGVGGWLRRMNSRLRHQYRYNAERWFRTQKEGLQARIAARKNRKIFTRNRERILSGNIAKVEAMWIFDRSPNDLGTGTINAIRDDYGNKIAQIFSTGLRAYWKAHDTRYADRATYLGSMGLAGLNLDWSLGELPSNSALSRKAMRFAFHELGGFPDWVEELARTFPTEFCSEIKIALSEDFNSGQAEDDHHTSDCISKIAYSGSDIRNLVAPIVLRMMMKTLPKNRRDRILCLDLIARSPNAEPKRVSRFLVSGFRRAWTRFDFREAWGWLDALMNANARAARSILDLVFMDLGGAQLRTLFFEYMGREANKPVLDASAGSVRKEYETDPVLLEWLVRAAFLAWPPENDVKHESVYSPDREDHAAGSRRSYVNMLSAISSKEVLEALTRLANAKDLVGHRDSFLYQIELVMRGAGRRPELSPEETIEYLNEQSKSPLSFEEFRRLCQAHLETLLEKLHVSDDDESAFFRGGAATENDLRNWLSARLRDVGERYYTVIREQEVAGEKRPDLRLHSRVDSLGKVSVEIKLADKEHWTGDLLVNTPGKQLSKQYLLEPSSHTGIYVLVNAARPRKPEVDKKKGTTTRKAFRKGVSGTFVNFDGLIQRVKAKCVEVNDGLADNKVVILVARDISEKPSETI